MIDRDKPQLFLDMECPRCGRTCGNGGRGDEFFCPSCGWAGKIAIHPDDIRAVQEFMRRAKERDKEEITHA